MFKNININNLKKMNDKKDKEILKKFSNQIQIFKIDSKNYIFGFKNKNTFEIIRLKGNVRNLKLLLNKFKNIIINIPIRDYDISNIINNLIKKNQICEKNIEQIKITNKYFLVDYNNNLQMIQIYLKNVECTKKISLKDISKKIQKNNNKKKICKILCFFEKNTIKKLYLYLDKKYKKEIGGIFKINNINHEILGNIYQVKIKNHKNGAEEDVDIIDSVYNFHTHPYNAYINHNCELGWPSLDDLKTYLYSFISYNTFFHAISTLEGIYIISIHPDCLNKLKSLNDIPLHLEKWIDKNLILSKENVKLPLGKHIKNFGNINSGEQFVKYMSTKKYPKWKCNIFSMIFLPWKILNENVYTCFAIYFPKVNGKCYIKKK